MFKHKITQQCSLWLKQAQNEVVKKFVAPQSPIVIFQFNGLKVDLLRKQFFLFSWALTHRVTLPLAFNRYSTDVTS